MIRVLIIAPTLPLIGGQSVQAQRLINNFKKEPDLQVDLQSSNPRLFPKLQTIRFLRTILTTFKYLIDLTVRIPRYDIIHVFSASYFTFVYVSVPAVLIARLLGKKTVLNYRSGEAQDFFSRWGKNFLSIVRLFDAVIVPSNYLVDVFAKFDVQARSITNFIDSGKYIFRNRVPLRPIFLSNRILEPLYNIDCILRAFQLIQKKYSTARLIIAHEGIERERLHRVSKELELENVEFVGLVPHEKIAALYDSADIYLNSPNLDCMPGSLIECFASGLPIVSTDAGGIPYIVKNNETGILVEKNDHEALAANVFVLLENDDLASKIITAAYSESKKYDWSNVREKWLALYRELHQKQ
jgi:glycosyltransferase involved in cell wall biosynthesis